MTEPKTDSVKAFVLVQAVERDVRLDGLDMVEEVLIIRSSRPPDDHQAVASMLAAALYMVLEDTEVKDFPAWDGLFGALDTVMDRLDTEADAQEASDVA